MAILHPFQGCTTEFLEVYLLANLQVWCVYRSPKDQRQQGNGNSPTATRQSPKPNDQRPKATGQRQQTKAQSSELTDGPGDIYKSSKDQRQQPDGNRATPEAQRPKPKAKGQRQQANARRQQQAKGRQHLVKEPKRKRQQAKGNRPKAQGNNGQSPQSSADRWPGSIYKKPKKGNKKAYILPRGFSFT